MVVSLPRLTHPETSEFDEEFFLSSCSYLFSIPTFLLSSCMNIATRLIPHLATALIRRIRYRYGFPFIASVALAVATIGASSLSRQPIWTFASWR
jgi:hypothetical protein